ncbi:hypothetical protein M8494_19215 [Serratia ureilytica]
MALAPHARLIAGQLKLQVHAIELSQGLESRLIGVASDINGASWRW